jgi:hypothetical protein
VLALTGDTAGARAALEAAMPGSSSRMGYFFQRLPTLRSDQKAAAVNLGIFPGMGTQVASAGSAAPANSGSEDRIGSIEQWLSQRPPAARATSQGTQIASVSLPPRLNTSPAVKADASIAGRSRLWLQLASGPNAIALPEQFERMKSRNRELFDGISGYVVEEPGKARLVIGPFRNSEEAGIFADDLQTVRIEAFPWTNRPGQAVRKLPGE